MSTLLSEVSAKMDMLSDKVAGLEKRVASAVHKSEVEEESSGTGKVVKVVIIVCAIVGFCVLAGYVGYKLYERFRPDYLDDFDDDFDFDDDLDDVLGDDDDIFEE